MEDIDQLKYKIVYLTPEKFASSANLKHLVKSLYERNKIDRFVIDEVHCVSHWGQDFRKDYLLLDRLKINYPSVPLLGLTATATNKVKDDIIVRLGIQDDYVVFQSSYNRPNLIYEIRKTKEVKGKDQDLANLLKLRFKGKCGIIYCISKKECERLNEVLRRNYKISCDFYHAGLSYPKRQEIQSKWMKNDL